MVVQTNESLPIQTDLYLELLLCKVLMCECVWVGVCECVGVGVAFLWLLVKRSVEGK